MIKDFKEYYQKSYKNVHLILRNNRYHIDINKTQFMIFLVSIMKKIIKTV
ncbi:hypothetical protein PBI_PBS1_216 [Bacillus phage PBS1]|uniref:Uncharacterized protein n=1 Tax=Bacillus phage PBS1 TaxID=2884423 RepID=A0A223LDG8_BPPB1|nr:hypothetical protein FK780_gp231 [Bacillus phage PBS1]ASU00038.1 hypothetical protein PBI_PBS1_216 [Bacillus phage PBS1]BDE75448.1 hypothetical protein [Bacillus phage PBS1]